MTSLVKELDSIFDAIVVGAGISGLAVAKRLRDSGRSVCVLEKSRATGGRMATRRDGLAAYDHGAQFYKLRGNQVCQIDQFWESQGVASIWFEKEESPINLLFKCGIKGMTSLTKALAQSQKLQSEEKVLKVKESIDASDPIEVLCESGNTFFGRKVFLTAPLPQSLVILDESQISYPPELARVRYASALVGLFEVQTTNKEVETFRYKDQISESIFSISNQLSKRVSSSLAFTVVMQPSWSESNFEGSEAEVLSQIQKLFTATMISVVGDFRVVKAQLKKWKYSHPTSIYPKTSEVVGTRQSIVLLGDAFGGPSIRGAIQSAESVLL